MSPSTSFKSHTCHHHSNLDPSTIYFQDDTGLLDDLEVSEGAKVDAEVWERVGYLVDEENTGDDVETLHFDVGFCVDGV